MRIGRKRSRQASPGRWEIEIAGERCAADASLAPFYDPKRERVRM
jgi:hypothetical protein